MNAQQIRQAYLDFFAERGHKVIPRALLVPQNDPTTLFTNSGMQPLLPYLLGEEHPYGKRLVDSQTCFRAMDIDEVGDNRHTTFFETEEEIVSAIYRAMQAAKSSSRDSSPVEG